MGLAFLVGVVLSVAAQQATIALGVTVAYLPLLVGVAVLTAYTEFRLDFRDTGRRASLWWQNVDSSDALSSALIYLSSALLLLSHYWGWPLPFAVTLLAVALAIRASSLPARSALSLIVIAGAGWCVTAYTTIMHPTWWFLDEDTYFYGVYGRGIALFGFWENPFVAGRPFNYHWLPYAWSGWLSVQVGDDRFALLTLLVPVLLAPAQMILFRSIIRELFTTRFDPLTVLFIAATTTPWITNRPLAAIEITNPGASFAHTLSLGLLLLTLQHRLIRDPGSIIVVTIIIVGLVGSRVQVALPVLAGLGAAILVMVTRVPRTSNKLLRSALLFSGTALSVWFFYLLLPSQGRIGFELRPKFDYMNTWGDLNWPTPQSTRDILGMVVAAGFLTPALLGVVFLGFVQRSQKIYVEPLVAFGTAFALVALFFAATTFQPSGTSFSHFSFAPTLGTILIAGFVDIRSKYVVAWGMIILLIWWLTVGKTPNLDLGLGASAQRFLPFGLITVSLLVALFLEIADFRSESSRNTRSPGALISATLVALFVMINAENYRALATQVIPQRDREIAAGIAPTKNEVAVARWIRENTPKGAILASRDLSTRLIGTSSRRWYVNSPVFAKDGTPEPSRRMDLIDRVWGQSFEVAVDTLRRERISFVLARSSDGLGVDSHAAGDWTNLICYTNSDFVIFATRECP